MIVLSLCDPIDRDTDEFETYVYLALVECVAKFALSLQPKHFEVDWDKDISYIAQAIWVDSDVEVNMETRRLALACGLILESDEEEDVLL